MSRRTFLAGVAATIVGVVFHKRQVEARHDEKREPKRTYGDLAWRYRNADAFPTGFVSIGDHVSDHTWEWGRDG